MSEHKNLDVAETFSNLEETLNKHKQTLTIIVGAVAVLIAGYYYYSNFYLPNQEKEAQSQMFMAQMYFENDSLKLAMEGDGNYLGLLSIIDDYGSTKAGNLAYYYVGICYLKAGDFQNAIDHLKKFDSDDLVVSSLALGAMGDAYMEMGDTENGIKYYQEAMEKNQNEFSTPILMMKTALALEKQQKYSEAKEIYQKIKDKYRESPEGKDIDKYIARAEARK